ncbi:hypothetical protein ABZY57_00745 [Streptomyces sp. NPDC006450]|uniref:hypothetical protein n=1 Tax=Streptomyces sp. NPDC006450 TaxID=3155458 RepID=UPI0033AB7CE4
MADAEPAVLARVPGTDGKIEGVVLGTLLGDAAIPAVRRIAQEDASVRRSARPEDGRDRAGGRVWGKRWSGRSACAFRSRIPLHFRFWGRPEPELRGA